MTEILKEIDWNLVWRTKMEMNREFGPGKDCASIWESRDSALSFWNMCLEEVKRIEWTVSQTRISPESRILDIGAGPGTLAIPFSRKVAHVTAVEPAAGMADVMSEKIAEFGINNIDIVRKRWEDIDVYRDLVAPYDVVIASFSLGMMDIQRAIEKMILASSKYVYLYHFAGLTSWDRDWMSLWPKLHGCEYHPGPKCDVLYNVLCQMGIYPNIKTFQLEHNQRYRSFDEAVSVLAAQARAETDLQKRILHESLGGSIMNVGDYVVRRGSSLRVMMWWKK